MSEARLQAVGVLPPSTLSVSTLTVVVGTTVNITKSLLMGGIPIYTQPQPNIDYLFGYPMGSIKIIQGQNDYREVFSATNVAQTKVYLTNDGGRVSATSQTSAIFNADVDTTIIDQGSFKVVGVAPGATRFNYVAKAIFNGTESNAFSTVIGTLIITVVPVAANSPATNIDDSLTLYPQGSNVTITMDMVSVGYTDPNNDPIWKVKILTLPSNGRLYRFGSLVTVNQEILASDIQSNALVFVPNPGLANNTISSFNFAVCDTGTGIYITT